MLNKSKASIIFAFSLFSSFVYAEESILFVCTGNTGRSVMAEYYANYYAQSKKLDIIASSAGIDVNSESTDPEKNAIKVMGEQDIDIADHQARQVSAGIINRANLILAMTEKQKQALLKIDPKAKNIHTLNECANGSDNDIEDAYGKPLDVYVTTRNQIEADIQKIYDNGGKCLNQK